MAEDELVVVHGDIVYLGGEFDEDSGKALYGDHWEDRIDSAFEEYGHTTAVAYLDRGSDLPLDHKAIKRPREIKDQTHLPYNFHEYDEILEDDSNGDLNEEQLESITSETEEVTLAGVWLNDCISTVVDNILEHDPEIEIKIDPEYTAVRPDTSGPEGLGNREEILNRTVEDVERNRAESPPAATQRAEKLAKFQSRYSREQRVNIVEDKNPQKSE
ncbi:hypothetical protein ACK3SF_02515 [Candidatus Nanosalina sp. VS9-1]|uniref:hypothetical protein n=1 Tax=Candidatus Nanosalina sp. VS9-1 TaxID=3388566 RepID=UPI0039DF5421